MASGHGLRRRVVRLWRLATPLPCHVVMALGGLRLRNQNPRGKSADVLQAALHPSGRFFFQFTVRQSESSTFAHDGRWRVRVLYLPRPSAAWPSHASAIPACGRRARKQESWSRRQSSQRALRRGTKLQRCDEKRPAPPRDMKSLDPCRAAIVRRYAAELAHGNHNSNGYAQVQLDLSCTGTRELGA